MSIKNVFFVLLFIKVMSGRLAGIVLSVRMVRLLLLLLLLLLTATELSLGGSIPYTSTDKTNKNKHTETKQYKKTQYKQYKTQ